MSHFVSNTIIFHSMVILAMDSRAGCPCYGHSLWKTAVLICRSQRMMEMTDNIYWERMLLIDSW